MRFGGKSSKYLNKNIQPLPQKFDILIYLVQLVAGYPWPRLSGTSILFGIIKEYMYDMSLIRLAAPVRDTASPEFAGLCH